MYDWVWITIFAAFSQNIRSALQKHLTKKLSTAGVTQVRFLYAVPFASLYLIFITFVSGNSLPALNGSFMVFAVIGGLAQIIASALLIALFSHRNFFAGTAFSKTETIQAAILGYVVLGDGLSSGALAGILVGIAGLITLNIARSKPAFREMLLSLKSRATLLGILSGLFFGVAAICYRGASTSLAGGYAVQASFTLLFVLLLQTAVMTAYLLKYEPGQMKEVLGNWKISWYVGLAGMLASAGWFTAMTLQNAGYVRALGQIELVFAFIASAIIFREKTFLWEFIAIFLILVSIVMILVYQ